MDPILTPIVFKVSLGILGGIAAWLFGRYVWASLRDAVTSFVKDIRTRKFGVQVARAARQAFALVRRVLSMAEVIYGIVDSTGAALSVVSRLLSWTSIPSQVIEVIILHEGIDDNRVTFSKV